MASKKGGFAAVGDDGMRPVVWGVGSSAAAALRDAKRWDAPAGLDVHPINAAQRARIKAGEVGWPVSKSPPGSALGS